MKSARGSDDLAGILNDFFTGKSKAYERHRVDKYVEEVAAELEAKRAREAKRNRPIQIKTFEI
jgi:hypothetical protein